MRILVDLAEQESYLQKLRRRADLGLDIDGAGVRRIVEAVRQFGDSAVRRFTQEFDGFCPENWQVPAADLEKAWETTAPALKTALTAAKERIAEYHRLQVPTDYELTQADGSRLSLRHRGLDKVGLYVPGGTAAYPSTVLMNAVPAKLAKVGELIMVTPPAKEPAAAESVLAAAWLAGVDRVFRIGGAQAIAALAYGTETVPAVDKIVGPGNRYVAAAKRLVYGIVDIDAFAGPSEILILADQTARPDFVAADLLSQAEHDPEAAAILITDSRALADQVAAEVRRQTEAAPRRDIIAQSLEHYGAVLVCRTTAEMIELTNRIAPEHLEIQTADPEALLSDIRHAGSIFIGPWAPEALGDYLAGTNHVLPTAGTARFASPLGVYSFVKRTSITYYTKPGLLTAAGDIITMAASEGLAAHGQAVRLRQAAAGRQP